MKDIIRRDELNNGKTKRNFIRSFFQDQKLVKSKDNKRDQTYINGVLAIFDKFLNDLKESNKDIAPNNNDKTITINLILKSSIYGLEETDLEKNFLTEALNEWAKGAFQTYESTIKYNVKIIDDTDKVKEEVSSFLYVKSLEYDIMMLDIVWIGQFKNYLLNIESLINSNTTNMYQKANINSCKSGTKLIALVCLFNF